MLNCSVCLCLFPTFKFSGCLVISSKANTTWRSRRPTAGRARCPCDHDIVDPDALDGFLDAIHLRAKVKMNFINVYGTGTSDAVLLPNCVNSCSLPLSLPLTFMATQVQNYVDMTSWRFGDGWAIVMIVSTDNILCCCSHALRFEHIMYKLQLQSITEFEATSSP